MSARMTAAKKAFIPSVGPVRTPSLPPHQSSVLKSGLQGYDDTKIRPWNDQWRRDRDSGAYYDSMCV